MVQPTRLTTLFITPRRQPVEQFSQEPIAQPIEQPTAQLILRLLSRSESKTIALLGVEVVSSSILQDCYRGTANIVDRAVVGRRSDRSNEQVRGTLHPI